MVHLRLNPNWYYKSYKPWLPVSLWLTHTKMVLHRFLNRADYVHTSTCKYRIHWLKHQLWLKSSFRLFCNAQPKIMDSLKAFSSLAAPLDGSLCSVNIQFSCMPNPNFFMLVRYRRIEQVAWALTILQKVYNKSIKNSYKKGIWMNEAEPNLQCDL